MDSTARSVSRPSTLFERLGHVMDLVGQPAFYPELLGLIAAHLRSDLSMMMRYSNRDAPEYLIHDDLRPEHMKLYLRGLYRVDPIYRLCRKETGEGVKYLTEISTPEELSGDYFNIFLRLTGMSDDLAILFPVKDGESIGLVYERRSPFLKREVAEIRGLFPVLYGLHRLHRRQLRVAPNASRTIGAEPTRAGRGLPPVDYKVAVDGFLRGELTPRERDIVSLVLLGYPTTKIAERLGRSIHTIKNHKKRMYNKLDITTERELFLRFVNFLFTEAPD